MPRLSKFGQQAAHAVKASFTARRGWARWEIRSQFLVRSLRRCAPDDAEAQVTLASQSWTCPPHHTAWSNDECHSDLVVHPDKFVYGIEGRFGISDTISYNFEEALDERSSLRSLIASEFAAYEAEIVEAARAMLRERSLRVLPPSPHPATPPGANAPAAAPLHAPCRRVSAAGSVLTWLCSIASNASGT